MKIIFENEDLLVIDKPAGIVSDDFPKRVHRLDKDTSGILLIAKNDKSLEFLQKQFKEREVEKKYILLVAGKLKANKGTIETLLGRATKDKRKQKVYLPHEPSGDKNLREAKTKYKVIERFKNFTLIEAFPKTGRKHQLRVQFAHLSHPIAGDKLYGFKNQASIPGLKRQFLHASHLKIKVLDGTTKKFYSELPEDLKQALNNLKDEQSL